MGTGYMVAALITVGLVEKCPFIPFDILSLSFAINLP